MYDQPIYDQFTVNLAKLAVELAIENKLLRDGDEPAQRLRQRPDFDSLFRQFEPLLLQLEKSIGQGTEGFRQASEALRRILDLIGRIHGLQGRTNRTPPTSS
jgi:hypothetical protein